MDVVYQCRQTRSVTHAEAYSSCKANSFKDQNEQDPSRKVESVRRAGTRGWAPAWWALTSQPATPGHQGRRRSPAAPEAAPQANQASERTQSQGLPQRLREAVTATHRSDRFVLTCGCLKFESRRLRRCAHNYLHCNTEWKS